MSILRAVETKMYFFQKHEKKQDDGTIYWTIFTDTEMYTNLCQEVQLNFMKFCVLFLEFQVPQNFCRKHTDTDFL